MQSQVSLKREVDQTAKKAMNLDVLGPTLKMEEGATSQGMRL